MLVVSFIIFYLISLFLLIEELSILQVQFYELKRYLCYKKDGAKRKKYSAIVISIIAVNIIGIIYLKYEILLLIFPVLLISLFYDTKKQKIIKFKYTNRVKRIISIYSVLSLLLGILMISISLKNSCILCVFELLIVLFYRVFISFIMMLDYLIEGLINNKYEKKAIQKLKRINPVLIGVTGSYGKTSFKNYLYQLLSTKYRVCKTPKSYNTYLGIIKSINEELNETDEIMIIELGADKVGSLDKVLSILNFDYSVLTSIGPQHIKTFKTIDNIVKEKSKLLDKTKKCVFLNYNNEYLRTIHKNKYPNVKTYSYYVDSDFYINAINENDDNTTFTLTYDGISEVLTTNILGSHQIENLLGAISIACYLNVDIKSIKNKIRFLNNEPHRMQIKYVDKIKIIDDSYNSNVKGFKSAVDVLEKQNNYRIIITPGVIELGHTWEKENRLLGEYLIDKLDYVVLVGINITRPLYLGLINKGFDENNILIVDSFKEGMEYIKSINKEITLLIENDLPDYYLK